MMTRDRAAGKGSDLGAVIRDAASRLQIAGSDTAELDARLLMQACLEIGHSDIISRSNYHLATAEIARFEEFIDRRINCEPVHRIIGHKEFRGLKLAIPGAVLEPRADSECLVSVALAWIDRLWAADQTLQIADIGTGSGAIILALLHELPQALATAVDISPGAIDVAKNNATDNGMADRITFLVGNYCQPLAGKFDVIVANPPYIPTADIAGLADDVRLYDPLLALDGGVDGLVAYRRLLGSAKTVLNTEGRVFFEIGYDQADAVGGIAGNFGWRDVRIDRDLAGNDRVFSASP